MVFSDLKSIDITDDFREFYMLHLFEKACASYKKSKSYNKKEIAGAVADFNYGYTQGELKLLEKAFINPFLLFPH